MTQSSLLPFKNWPGVDDARSWGQPHFGRATFCAYMGVPFLGVAAVLTFGGEGFEAMAQVAQFMGLAGLALVFLWYFQREAGRRKSGAAPYLALGVTEEDIRAGVTDMNERTRRYHDENKEEIDILAQEFYRISTDELGLHPDYVVAQLAVSGENINYPRAMEWHMHGHTAEDAARSLYLWSAIHARGYPNVFVRNIETGKERSEPAHGALFIAAAVVAILFETGLKLPGFSMSPPWKILAPILSTTIGITGGIIAYGSARRLHAVAALRSMSPLAKCMWVALFVSFAAWISLRGSSGLGTMFWGEGKDEGVRQTWFGSYDPGCKYYAGCKDER